MANNEDQAEKSMWAERRAQLEQITTDYNTQISNLKNQQKELEGERAAAQQQYQDALKKPHEKLDQLMGAQDKIAQLDKDLDNNAKAVAGKTSEVRETINERVEVDQNIKRLDEKIETAQKIEEFKSNVGEKIESGVEFVKGKVEYVKEHAEHLAMAGTMAAVDFAHVHHGVVEGMGNPEMLRNVVAGAVVEHVVAHHDELIENAKEKLQGIADADAQKLEADKAFHAEQLGAVDKFKTEVGSQIDASTAEMQKVMGNEWSLAGQKEFAQNEFNAAFQKANDFIAEQQQARDNFFAGNISVLSPVEQQQNRTGMNEELHAAHYGLTRNLAEKQAELNVDLANEGLRQQQEQRLESKGVSQEQMPNEMKPLNNILAEQRPNDVYMEANNIHAQQCPQMAMNPPSISQEGPPAHNM